MNEVFEWRDQQVRWSRRGTGPAVVFCHGTPFSAAVWEPIAAALSAEYTVHLWDMVGYGRSSQREGQDVSLAAQGELLAALLEHWQLTGPDAAPHVVAHDFGGAVSLRAHLLHGARFRSMALVDVVALAPWGTEFFRLVAAHPEVFDALPAPLHEALTRAYIRGAAHSRLTDEQERALVEPWLGTTGQAAFYRQITQGDQRYTDEIEGRYPSIDVPTLVIWGEEDAWLSVDRARRLAALIPGAELRLVPGAGHLVQLDAPAALTAELQRWLYRQGGV